jgi:hypothetical protein
VQKGMVCATCLLSVFAASDHNYFVAKVLFSLTLNALLFLGREVFSGSSGGGFVIKRGQLWFLRGISRFGTTESGQTNADFNSKPGIPMLFVDLGHHIKWIKRRANL